MAKIRHKNTLKSLLNQDVGDLVLVFVYAVLHNLMAGIEVVVASHLALLPETRTSNPLSKLLRPLLEHKRIKALFGANLAGAMIIVGSVASASGAVEVGQPETTVVPADEVVVTTEQRFHIPVAELTGISQGFSLFHRGVDMRAPVGTVVVPVSKGRVIQVVTGKVGYGKYVVVEHEGGYTSLYAHLKDISVKPGQEVTQGVQLGTIGLTGWTTGPHLHLEVYEKGKAFNPLSVVNLPENSTSQASHDQPRPDKS